MPKTKNTSWTKKEPKEAVKEFCKKLRLLGVTKISADYDGSGDSGDFNGVCYMFTPDAVSNDNDIVRHTRLTGRPDSMMSHSFRKNYIADVSEEEQIVSVEEIDIFEGLLFELLPGGWEINSGSFGEITVNTETGKICVEHNERIEEINTSNYEL